ncbi:MAG: bifunctional 3-deoxy-7-phosphoheptulonate synthase/chorismate mutase type II [Bacteroidetes bacterium]|nr:bifunctional 3-deoxy-7-phosphoheptulonate synthase/chorismate mutase type II [Bacteroidota bacterium]
MNPPLDIAPFTSWSGGKLPLVIAGPCSAETEDQVLQTVKRMVAASDGISMIRAGVWKPRTRPNSFEGVGAIGLPWVKAAGNAVGLPVTVEVANSGHVELALKNEIDVLWIGARTTVSPFIVQEIAEALRGIDIPVMIKNPVNPDLQLWLGAIERFTQIGITKIAAIHRGFSTYEKSAYRNPPMWEIPIELRRRYPQIPIIVDPSHMGGTRDLIYPLSQQAMDMGFDGLMIETHINPDKAWSDAKQQVTPEALGAILRDLVVRQPHLEHNEFHTLHELRAKVDRIDDYIIEMLAERMGISEQIGQFKKDHDLAIHQSERWAAIVKRALANGKTGGLTEDFILKLFQQIHNESIIHQGKVMGK